MPKLPASIGANFNGQVQVEYHDLGKTRERPAAGLTDAVRKSFSEKISSNRRDAVGVVGWTFTQYGLNYACSIRDDDNRNVYGFRLEIPKGREHLHPSDTLSIAEKIHILNVVEQLMSDEKKPQHLGDLFGLEKACFEKSSGIVDGGPRVPPTVLNPQGYVTGHCGLIFQNDQQSLQVLRNKKPLEAPEPKVFLLEWQMDGKKYEIDCMQPIPRFRVGYAANPNMPMMIMSKPEAKLAVDYVRTKVHFSDTELARICGATGLWKLLEVMVGTLSDIRQPC